MAEPSWPSWNSVSGDSDSDSDEIWVWVVEAARFSRRGCVAGFLTPLIHWTIGARQDNMANGTGCASSTHLKGTGSFPASAPRARTRPFGLVARIVAHSGRVASEARVPAGVAAGELRAAGASGVDHGESRSDDSPVSHSPENQGVRMRGEGQGEDSCTGESKTRRLDGESWAAVK